MGALKAMMSKMGERKGMQATTTKNTFVKKGGGDA